jgi:hypothetical protein
MSVYRPDARERPHLRPAHGIAQVAASVTTRPGQDEPHPESQPRDRSAIYSQRHRDGVRCSRLG